jgi:uncharacterized membrane protein YfcA
MDLIGTWAYRRTWDRRCLAHLLPGALAGSALGALTFGLLDDQWIRLLVGGLAVVFVLDRAFGLSRRLTAARRRRGRGARRAQRLHQLRHPRRLAAGLDVSAAAAARQGGAGRHQQVFFLVVNYVKLPPYGWLGLLSADNVLTALALAPLAPLGIWLGVRLNRVVSQLWFYRASYAFLLAAGLKLLYDGLRPSVG